MNVSPNLEHRLSELEDKLAGQHRRRPVVVWLGLWGMITAFSVLVALQLWLVNQTLDRQQADKAQHLFWLICHPGASAEARTEAFLGLVNAKNREWRSAQLDNLKLPGVKLDRAELEWGLFEASDFSNASLVETNFTRADLRLVNLNRADLSGARLVEANLLRAKLHEAQLDQASLVGAVMQQAELRRAELAMADLSDANLLMADLTEANLIGTNLAGATLDGAILRRANLTLANLSGTSLDHTDFQDSTWWKARGLSPSQLTELQQKFAPSSDVSTSRREGYEAWLQQFNEASQVDR